MENIVFVANSCVVGCGVYVLLRVFLLRRKGMDSRRIDWQEIDEICCLVFSISGLILLGVFIYEHLVLRSSMPENDRGSQFIGYYFHWLPLLYIVVVTQLFWLKQVKRNAWLRVAIANGITLLIFSEGIIYERLVIILTSLRGDYLPSSWVGVMIDMVLLKWLFYLGVFSFIVTAVYFAPILLRRVKVGS